LDRISNSQVLFFASLRETAFVAVEGSGHNIPGERPDIVIAAIQELIRKLHP